jgi:ankyrin repeat protein
MEICVFAREGNLAEVRRLLELDPDLINAHNILGVTPLNIAADHGHADIVKLLLDYGADGGWDGYADTPLTTAAREGYADCVRVLLDHPGSAHFWDYQPEDGETALQCSLQQPEPEIVRLLVQKGGDVHASGSFSLFLPGHPGPVPCSSLFLPCWHGHVRVVRFLLEMGVDPTVVNDRGAKAIDIARQRGHQECVTALEVRVPVVRPDRELLGHLSGS